MVQEHQKFSAEESKQIMGFHGYGLTLEHAMLLGLEDTGRWYLQKNAGSQRQVPNFLSLICIEPLRIVKPEAVRLEK